MLVIGSNMSFGCTNNDYCQTVGYIAYVNIKGWFRGIEAIHINAGICVRFLFLNVYLYKQIVLSK